ncbi:MAG: hypothetical protein QM728_02510 [Gordonia sp. (in: high G+C Gram-positive bacteria)]|uniref:hypothetical protein n=1 Tax=Gordonia sp. (in: high G+C Gram-positive bacteria) TaxID=84139 RepID=UPI0039E39B88
MHPNYDTRAAELQTQYAQQYPTVVGYPAPDVKPTSAQAAIVLSWLGVLANVVGLLLLFPAMAILEKVTTGGGSLTGYIVVSGLVGLVCAVLLGIGASGLSRRKASARPFIAIACVLVVASQIFGIIMTAGMTVDVAGASTPVNTAGSGFGTLMGCVFPIITVVLTYSSSTTEWLRRGLA